MSFQIKSCPKCGSKDILIFKDVIKCRNCSDISRKDVEMALDNDSSISSENLFTIDELDNVFKTFKINPHDKKHKGCFDEDC